MSWKNVDVVLLEMNPGRLCARPYPGHPYGCVNYGVKTRCPPFARRWTREMLDYFECWAIWTRYDIAARERELKTLHPNWTKKQCRCSRYWQGTARKNLREEIERFSQRMDQREVCVNDVYTTPEANGVNVTATMAQIGVKLRWPPQRFTYQVAIALVRI